MLQYMWALPGRPFRMPRRTVLALPWLGSGHLAQQLPRFTLLVFAFGLGIGWVLGRFTCRKKPTPPRIITRHVLPPKVIFTKRCGPDIIHDHRPGVRPFFVDLSSKAWRLGGPFQIPDAVMVFLQVGSSKWTGGRQLARHAKVHSLPCAWLQNVGV